MNFVDTVEIDLLKQKIYCFQEKEWYIATDVAKITETLNPSVLVSQFISIKEIDKNNEYLTLKGVYLKEFKKINNDLNLKYCSNLTLFSKRLAKLYLIWGRSVFKKIRPRNNNGGVYFISCRKYVKIGVSKNIKKRLFDLQASNPYKLILVKFFKTSDCFNLENILHKKFKHLREKGEWFRYTEEIKQFLSLNIPIEEIIKNNEEIEVVKL
jgi:hypothetical protein